MIYKKTQARLNELCGTAAARFLAKFDFDAYDWLEDEEKEEYEKLMVETGQQERSG